jgi:adenosyl cobinamide kinase/adenosyl cobinamide phosphate guanylyltransferase
MPLTVLLGGARSGKSALAVRMAASAGRPVTVMATGEGLDAEMVERIERHRLERPAGWATVEEPREIGAALDRIDPEHVVIVDCLTLWVSNLLGTGTAPDGVPGLASGFATSAAARPGPVVAVTNEVGLGIVPVHPLGRAYRDALGRVNSIVVAAATAAYLVVAGRALPLHDLALAELPL